MNTIPPNNPQLTFESPIVRDFRDVRLASRLLCTCSGNIMNFNVAAD